MRLLWFGKGTHHVSAGCGPLTLTLLRLIGRRRRGWNCCRRVAGTLIVRVGPLVLTWWRRV